VIDSQLARLVELLRRGEFDAALAAQMNKVSFDDVVTQLRADRPAVFLERKLSRKHELGLARAIRWELGVGLVGTPPAPVRFGLVLRSCLLLSGYDGRLTEITVASSIRVHPLAQASGQLRVRMKRAFKLDRMADSWELKQLPSKAANLPESLLVQRGWDPGILSFAHGYPGITRTSA
jgi:hypothetical protein